MDTPTANTLLTTLYLSAYTLVIAGRHLGTPMCSPQASFPCFKHDNPCTRRHRMTFRNRKITYTHADKIAEAIASSRYRADWLKKQ
mgnify:CR=1 FL=1